MAPAILPSTFLHRVENALGNLFSNYRGRDSGLLTAQSVFTSASSPSKNLVVRSPDCPDDQLKVEHSADGTGLFPTLNWTWDIKAGDEASKEVGEWIVVNEDPDAPLPSPIVHGIYYGIPAAKTSLTAKDFELVEGTKLSGGFQYGANRRNNIYIPPRPIIGHGPHRYVFEVIGVKQGLGKELEGLGKGAVTKEEVLKRLEGKVVAWGVWMGSYERKLGS